MARQRAGTWLSWSARLPKPRAKSCTRDADNASFSSINKKDPFHEIDRCRTCRRAAAGGTRLRSDRNTTAGGLSLRPTDVVLASGRRDARKQADRHQGRQHRNETIGDINEIVLGKDGKVAAVIVGVGGFLGMGEREVAMNFDSLRINRDSSNNLVLAVNATKDVLKSAPEWRWDATKR